MTQAPSEELVLLTSYFNLAGGRRQDTADTFKVESSVPSGTSPDGVAALYVVTEASTGGNIGPRARRLAAETIAWEYQEAASAAPAQRLRGALRAAHTAVADEGDGHVAIGAGVIAVEGDSIFLAQVSPAQVYVLHEGQLHSITATEERATFSRALGATAGPEISLFRDQISTGDVLALVSSWYARGADQDDVRECFSAGTAEDIAESLLDLARASGVRDVTGIVIEAVDASAIEQSGDDEEIPGFMEQVDAAVSALAGVGRMLWTELRTSEPVDSAAGASVPGDGTQPSSRRSRTGASLADDDHIDAGAGMPMGATATRPRRGFLSGLRFPARDEGSVSADEDEFDPLAPSSFQDDDDQSWTPRRGISRPPDVPGEQRTREDEYPSEIEPSVEPEPYESSGPYQVYREQATDEVPAVSAEVGPSTPTESDDSGHDELMTGDEQQEQGKRPSWRDGATTEIELPTQNTAEIPAFDPYAEPPPSTPRRSRRLPRYEEPVEDDEPIEEPPEEPKRRRLFGRETRTRRSPIRHASAPRSDEIESEPANSAELDAVNSRLGQGPDMADVVPPVQAFPDTSTQPSRIYATSRDVQAANKRPRRFGGVSRPINDPLAGPAVMRPGVDLDLRRPVSRSAPPAAVWGIGVLFLALLVLAGYLYFSHRHSVAATNPYPALVRTDIRKAQAAKLPAKQDAWLTKAHTNLALARQHGDTTADLNRLSAALGATTDTLHHITHVVNPIVLTDFSKYPSAKPTQIAVSPGVVDVLDTGRKGVFSVVPNSTSNPTEIVTDGENLDGFTIGAPQEVATDGQTALVLDTNNVVVRDLNGTQSATSLTPGAPNVHYVQMGSSDPDIYLLDPRNSQVWRYPYGVADFNPPPAMYFDTNKPDLTNAVSFVYDGADLYILKHNGTVVKFDINASPVQFTAHTLTPLSNPSVIYSDQGLKFLWIADPSQHRIVQIDKSGGYIHTYESPLFSSLTSMAVGPAGNTVFFLSGSKLVSFNLTK
jgi:hypothetical protein